MKFSKSYVTWRSDVAVTRNRTYRRHKHGRMRKCYKGPSDVARFF